MNDFEKKLNNFCISNGYDLIPVFELPNGEIVSIDSYHKSLNLNINVKSCIIVVKRDITSIAGNRESINNRHSDNFERTNSNIGIENNN